jgi:hypothetical protein
MKCEKHSRKEEALAKLKEGVKFDEVAREFSEDKARQGEINQVNSTLLPEPDATMYRRITGLEDQGQSRPSVRDCSICP